jgi:REP element-mobilizing transposase RayT
LRNLLSEGSGVVPYLNRRYEPLVAIYPKAALPIAETHLSSCEYSMQKFVQECVAQHLVKPKENPIERRSPFHNLNTPQDMASIVGRVSRRAPCDAQNGFSNEIPTQTLRRLDRVWINHGQPTYFITICTDRRKKVLVNDAVHVRLQEFLRNTASHHDWWVSRYVLMPNHLHMLAARGLSAITLGKWIKALKACVSNRDFKWQTGFFDHVLRSSESESEKWDYVRRNPERAGLVKNADDWPFAGEINWAQGDVDHHTSPRRETRPTTVYVITRANLALRNTERIEFLSG